MTKRHVRITCYVRADEAESVMGRLRAEGARVLQRGGSTYEASASSIIRRLIEKYLPPAREERGSGGATKR